MSIQSPPGFSDAITASYAGVTVANFPRSTDYAAQYTLLTMLLGKLQRGELSLSLPGQLALQHQKVFTLNVRTAPQLRTITVTVQDAQWPKSQQQSADIFSVGGAFTADGTSILSVFGEQLVELLRLLSPYLEEQSVINNSVEGRQHWTLDVSVRVAETNLHGLSPLLLPKV